MAELFGDYGQTIDAKRRLPITALLREYIEPSDGANFVMVLGPNDRLWLYADQYFRRLYRELKSSDLPNEEFEAMADYFAGARMLKPDAQGRVVLPEKALEEADLTVSEVTLVGKDDHIEVWPTEAWQQQKAQRKTNQAVVKDLLSTTSRRLSRKSSPDRDETT
jgi:transcriptional regulator MraZ